MYVKPVFVNSGFIYTSWCSLLILNMTFQTLRWEFRWILWDSFSLLILSSSINNENERWRHRRSQTWNYWGKKEKEQGWASNFADTGIYSTHFCTTTTASSANRTLVWSILVYGRNPWVINPISLYYRPMVLQCNGTPSLTFIGLKADNPGWKGVSLTFASTTVPMLWRRCSCKHPLIIVLHQPSMSFVALAAAEEEFIKIPHTDNNSRAGRRWRTSS